MRVVSNCYSGYSLMIGQTLGHYRIEAKLGEGGMGVVWRARDERLQRDVALKVLPAGALGDETVRRRFRKEAITLSQLNHPNIATVHDFDTQEGVDFLVLEYIPGETLDAKLSAESLAEKEILQLGIQLAQGLAAAHERGVVHRDLKPGNLRLTPDGRLKILDFGLATLKQPESDIASTVTMTGSHSFAGTLPYMAPEQLRGEKIDARADVFAAGAVLYEMATGRRAFPQPGGPELLTAILHRMPEIPAGPIGSIILKCLDKDPELRYQSARELRVDLERIATPVSQLAPGQGRAVARRQIFVAACVAALLTAAAGWWTFTRMPASRIERLAVLPLENLSGDPAQEYFADGMTEALITHLGKISALRVISRSAVMPYKTRRKAVKEVASELKADAVVEASVLRAGDRVRITVRLIDPDSDRQLWSQDYVRDFRDILALQSQVASAIAAEIRARVTASERARLETADSVNPQAYELYLRGKFFSERPSKENNQTAIEMLERAVATDPKFAAAYAALAEAYRSRFFSFAPEERKLWEEKAHVALEKALALDPELAEAYHARGRLLWMPANRFPHEKAIMDYRRALALNPNLEGAHLQLGQVYYHVGLLDEALQAVWRAAELNPTAPTTTFQIAATLTVLGRHAEALTAWSSLPRGHLPPVVGSHTAWVLFQLGRKNEASARIQEFIQSHAEDTGGAVAGIEALLLAAAGDELGAEQRIRSAAGKQDFGHFHHTAYFLACAYARMNKRTEALQWLQHAAENGFPCYPLFARDPNLNSMRSDDRFVAFLESEKKQWEQRKATLRP